MSNKPKFVRGEDGVLMWNPNLSPWDTRSYQEPDEALNVYHAGELRLGCTHRRFESYSSFPCGKTPKHDPDKNGRPTKCGIHSAAAKAKREAKADAKYQAERLKRKRQAAQARLMQEAPDIIRQIAEGHNDPRSLALDWLNRLAEAKE